MADTYDGPFAGVADLTMTISAAQNTAIQANIALVKALIPDITADPPVVATTPDFDQIPPHTAVKLRAELDALATTLTNALT